MEQVINTERLVLRPFAEADTTSLVRLIGDYDVAKWLARVPHPYTEDDAASWRSALSNGDVTDVWALEFTEELAGGVSLEPAGTKRERRLGYWLGKPFWGKGLMTEATSGLLRAAFDDGMETVHSGHFIGNNESARVLEKLGFESIGLGETYSRSQGKNLPEQKLTLTKERWRAVTGK